MVVVRLRPPVNYPKVALVFRYLFRVHQLILGCWGHWIDLWCYQNHLYQTALSPPQHFRAVSNLHFLNPMASHPPSSHLF